MLPVGKRVGVVLAILALVGLIGLVVRAELRRRAEERLDAQPISIQEIERLLGSETEAIDRVSARLLAAIHSRHRARLVQELADPDGDRVREAGRRYQYAYSNVKRTSRGSMLCGIFLALNGHQGGSVYFDVDLPADYQPVFDGVLFRRIRLELSRDQPNRRVLKQAWQLAAAAHRLTLLDRIIIRTPGMLERILAPEPDASREDFVAFMKWLLTDPQTPIDAARIRAAWKRYRSSPRGKREYYAP